MTQTDPDPSDRDRAEEFIQDKANRLSGRGIKLRVESAKILTALAKKDPDAWQAFVDDVTIEVVCSRLRSYLASQRHAAIHAERTSIFRTLHEDTVTAIRSGGTMPSPFEARYAVPGTNNWLKLGEMTRVDLLAVSHHRARLSRTNAIESIFLDALAARLPDDQTTVAQALTEDDVLSVHDKAESSDLGDIPNPETDTDKDPS